jgi:hypothetical protein
MLSIRLLFHLPLRQAEGFVTSIFQLMKLDLPIQDRGYDQKLVYDVVGNRKHAIHPRRNAVLPGKEAWTMRGCHVHRIKKDGVVRFLRLFLWFHV